MSTIDHGNWLPYKPAELPEGVPANAMFARRESDQVDWYEYSRGDNFSENTVKFAAFWHNGIGYVVGAAVYDATMIFPANQIVAEITDYTGSDPQADFGNKVYDPETVSFTDQPTPEPRPDPSALIAELQQRIERLEARK